MRQRLILDTDPGLDDAFAFVVARRYAEIVGITTVAGNVGVAKTTSNALALAELLDIAAPVHIGAAVPLVGEPLTAAQVHGETGMGAATLPSTDRVAASSDAVGFLVEATRAEEGLHLVAIGPLTNVASALRADPALANRISSITLMGGSATMGNVTPTAEFNIYADPEAAAETFRSGAPITMAGLNLTNQVRFTPAHAEQLLRLGTEVSVLCAQLIEWLSGFYQRVVGRQDVPMHDPCAVLAVVRPDLFQGHGYPVGVETRGELTRGMTWLTGVRASRAHR